VAAAIVEVDGHFPRIALVDECVSLPELAAVDVAARVAVGVDRADVGGAVAKRSGPPADAGLVPLALIVLEPLGPLYVGSM
jgi:hypothetical protein